jgi:hypothetical protein
MPRVKKTTPKEVFSTRVREGLTGKIRGAAKSTDMTVSELTEMALEFYIKELEKNMGKRFRAVGPRPMRRAA